jgi:asparagine synthetase B (glutamine-hydrolysing)
MPGGYNNWFSVDASGSKFQLKFNKKASTLYENFDQAADNAAQLLYQEWGHKPLYLALSGGLDSELTARILVKNNIPFTPVILKIKDYNEVETW